MRTGLLFLTLMFGLLLLPLQAEIYRWTDANGNTAFGDSPPKSVKARPVDLPLLTIADSFSPEGEGKEGLPEETATPSAEEDASYTDFRITAPADGDTIRSNNGSVTIQLALKPALREGDEITLYVDARQVAGGKTLAFSLPEMDRGEHSAFAVLTDAEGNIILNTDPVTFTLLRYSAL